MKKLYIEGIVSDEPTRKDKQAILTVDFKNIIASSSKWLYLVKDL
jgi:hypothetical protein